MRAIETLLVRAREVREVEQKDFLNFFPQTRLRFRLSEHWSQRTVQAEVVRSRSRDKEQTWRASCRVWISPASDGSPVPATRPLVGLYRRRQADGGLDKHSGPPLSLESILHTGAGSEPRFALSPGRGIGADALKIREDEGERKPEELDSLRRVTPGHGPVPEWRVAGSERVLRWSLNGAARSRHSDLARLGSRGRGSVSSRSLAVGGHGRTRCSSLRADAAEPDPLRALCQERRLAHIDARVSVHEHDLR